MAGGLGRPFQTSAQRRITELSEGAPALGWTVTAADGSSATFTGRASDGTDFTLRVSLIALDDGTPDSVVWSSGPPRLDELLIAITDAPDRSRNWLHLVEQGVTLEHEGLDPQALRDELNARAAEGMSPQELNEYALQLGAGGVTGLVQRFSQSASEVQDGLPPAPRKLQVLAADPAVASRVFREPAVSILPAVLDAAKVQRDPSFLAWVGLPFSRIDVETPSVTAELLQDVVELGAALRRGVLRQPEW
jgi:hypothetical protein